MNLTKIVPKYKYYNKNKQTNKTKIKLHLISLYQQRVPSGRFTSKIHNIVHYRLEGLLVSKYISWKEPDHNIKLQYKYQIDVGELFLLQKDKKENKCYVSKPNSI